MSREARTTTFEKISSVLAVLERSSTVEGKLLLDHVRGILDDADMGDEVQSPEKPVPPEVLRLIEASLREIINWSESVISQI